MISRTSFSLVLSVLAIVLALIALSVQAQDIAPKPAPTKRAWITEFSASRIEATIAALPSLRKQPALDLSDGLPKSFLPTDANTHYVRIMCEVQCAISSTGDASIDDIVLPLLHPEYFLIGGVQTISVILAP